MTSNLCFTDDLDEYITKTNNSQFDSMIWNPHKQSLLVPQQSQHQQSQEQPQQQQQIESVIKMKDRMIDDMKQKTQQFNKQVGYLVDQIRRLLDQNIEQIENEYEQMIDQLIDQSSSNQQIMFVVQQINDQSYINSVQQTLDGISQFIDRNMQKLVIIKEQQNVHIQNGIQYNYDQFDRSHLNHKIDRLYNSNSGGGVSVSQRLNIFRTESKNNILKKSDSMFSSFKYNNRKTLLDDKLNNIMKSDVKRMVGNHNTQREGHKDFKQLQLLNPTFLQNHFKK